MTIVDIIIILFILIGAVAGFKKGAIKSLVALVGTIVIIVLSYLLKNPVATLLLKYVPFMELHGDRNFKDNFSGAWNGLVTLNILLYEGIAYVIVFAVLAGILGSLVNLSALVEKLLDATIILGIPSKIIGAVLGFVESIAFAFIVLFVLLQVNETHEAIAKSSLANSILEKTPVLKSLVENTYNAIVDISELKDKYQNDPTRDAYNAEILNIMLDYEVIMPDLAEDLVKSGKVSFVGAEAVIEKFKEGNNND